MSIIVACKTSGTAREIAAGNVAPDAAVTADTAPAMMPPAPPPPGAAQPCDRPRAAGVTTVNLVSGGRARTFRLFVPRRYDGRARLPLVLNLHGTGSDATTFAADSGWEAIGEREGLLVAGLAADGGVWNVPPTPARPDDVAYARDVIDQVDASTCLDGTRVYATGFSGGGRMSSLLGCRLPDRITALGPVAGVRWPGPCPGRPMPVVAIHGLDDPLNTYAGAAPGRTPGVWEESVEDAMQGWAARNGCAPTRVEEHPPGAVSTFRWTGCQQAATVELTRLAGVGHAYPRGAPIDTPEVLWRFLAPHQIQR